MHRHDPRILEVSGGDERALSQHNLRLLFAYLLWFVALVGFAFSRWFGFAVCALDLILLIRTIRAKVWKNIEAHHNRQIREAKPASPWTLRAALAGTALFALAGLSIILLTWVFKAGEISAYLQDRETRRLPNMHLNGGELAVMTFLASLACIAFWFHARQYGRP